MRVVHLSTSDIQGGAARAAYRLHQGLQAITGSRMLVQSKASDDPTVERLAQSALAKGMAQLRPLLDNLPLRRYPRCDPFTFSLQYVPQTFTSRLNQLRPDILQLHWVTDGYVPIAALPRLPAPMVWTLHDMWPLTGGCHYSHGCDRYQQICGACPQLSSQRQRDLSRWVWQRKARYWRRLNLTLVAPSQWLAECVRASSLLGQRRLEVIPYGIDLRRYQRVERSLARQWLHLPQDKQLVLAGVTGTSSDYRKGVHLLVPALQELSRCGYGDRIEVVQFGSQQALPEVGLTVHNLGKLQDDLSLALIYAAVDGFVLPTLEDNLPNTILEALACGTPCVAFQVGGLPDLIDHQENGYLAKPGDVADLVRGIGWILENDAFPQVLQSERQRQLAAQARQKAEQSFSLELQAWRYLALYEELLAQTKPRT